MNFKAILYVLGKIYILIALLLILPLAVSFYYSENTYKAFLIPMVILLVLGFVSIMKKPKNFSLYNREGLVICGLAWIVMSCFGSIPFIISGSIPNVIDAFFETVSGFTTTGATIINDIETQTKSILFWRSMTHFIGGMGILSFMIAFIPKGESHSMFVMKAEAPGPSVGKVVSKIQTSARVLYLIYFILTAIEFFLLKFVAHLKLYDAVTISLSTAGTGGFASYNDSILGINSSTAEWIIAVFMFLFAVNFNIYFLFFIKLFSKKPIKSINILKDTEFLTYLGVNVAAVIIISLDIRNMYSNIFDVIRHSVFNVNTIMSTTGFCTVDFDKWNTLSKIVIVLLMICGGCAGSTGGGIKVSRMVIYAKEMFKSLKKSLRPNIIVRTRMNGKVIERDTVHGVNTYLVIYCFIIAISCFVVAIDNFDTTTTLTSVLACVNNVGPGLSIVGPTGNYSDFSILSKLILCFDMLAGRLEIFPLLVLFNPNTYRK